MKIPEWISRPIANLFAPEEEDTFERIPPVLSEPSDYSCLDDSESASLFSHELFPVQMSTPRANTTPVE